jgi:hypothetical protein
MSVSSQTKSILPKSDLRSNASKARILVSTHHNVALEERAAVERPPLGSKGRTYNVPCTVVLLGNLPLHTYQNSCALSKVSCKLAPQNSHKEEP